MHSGVLWALSNSVVVDGYIVVFKLWARDIHFYSLQKIQVNS